MSLSDTSCFQKKKLTTLKIVRGFKVFFMPCSVGLADGKFLSDLSFGKILNVE